MPVVVGGSSTVGKLWDKIRGRRPAPAAPMDYDPVGFGPGAREKLAVRPVQTGAGSLSLAQHKQAWQQEAWDAYRDNVGEYASVTDWRANCISRANLFVAKIDSVSDTQPTAAEDARLDALLERLGTGGDTGYSQLLKRMSIHLDVPGETILVGHQLGNGGQVWFPAAPDQIVPYGGGLAVRLDDSGLIDPDTGRELDYLVIPPQDRDDPTPPQTVLKRIYEPDPKEPWLAISPGRHARKSLRILDRLTDRVNANTLSRLTNKILLLSSNVMLPTAPDRADLHKDPQMAGLIQAGMTAVRNPESPAAVMPIIGRVSGNPGECHSEIDMGTSFDEQLVPLMDLFIRRLALALNVPPEILLGVTDANHWSAYLVSDDTVRVNLAPTLELICDALTRAYLRPAIVDLNAELGRPVYNPYDYTVWYDTVRLVQRPNRTENALANYEAGLISAAATAEASGWDTSDRPTPAEVRQRILNEALANGTAPADVAWYLEAMGLNDIPPDPELAGGPSTTAPAISTPSSPIGPGL